MKKRKRYQLTENQFKNVIRVIPENYPSGVTDSNFDRLSGADRDQYDYISDVNYKTKTGDIIFTVESYQGQSFTKKVWTGDDDFMRIIERELPKYGYNLQENPEWDIIDVSMNKRYIIFNISDYNSGIYQVPIHSDDFIDILPEMGGEQEHQWHNPEPDYDRDVDNY